MRPRASGLALSTVVLLLATRASHARAEPFPRAVSPGARRAADLAPDEPGRYSVPGYDVQVTVEVKESQDAESMNPSPARRAPPPKLAVAEKVRRYRALGLPETRLGTFLRSGVSLTHWFNEEHIGGHGLKVGGWLLIAFGAASLVAGIVLTVFMVHNYFTDEGDDGGMSLLWVHLVGIPAMVAGVLELGAGIPLVVVGRRRTRRWAKEGELETVPLEELERRRDRSKPRSKTTVSLAPYLTRGGGGLSLSLRF